ncbi:MAG: hypothetical protein A2268_02320 [Candidatus Raymondbacteria bacterium RifOxyA12_full_50_37]|uniref:Response regulatory domain-containing protein n=1 Tax=Candidatus Raymondbacteria bacterium RIFOXYD12_FULL_49_13 TaxID=1817890 RepID=A0A1F7FLS9_UNCRA|nr:MAG: hypothetical protein A2248_15895 [Candidatus Raymondbacteria bacterium RIFOXYA2_FULL_49_16]OGJ90587.1 MAG: hypothetical protein A2268_02320 [Candidatus Raymondbacteria bacterium RifOxyA12_full_50_37]OGJ99410.1 MAG: hypothetical protein A2453_05335 [Candidatus Raymondbacteria bacterium RIFOXYC2_FULL_50_21]OGJ99589.1 MAG: hypothetical protein A2350_06105 [Candidatus Raymondbacteria bacterium RifOxyB12_full_50_8]OGK03453.1 MAG: hypothetical protein A2487_18750 [Candidatus Raymondbacteria b
MKVKKILIVDDSPTMLRILQNTLAKAGFPDSITACHGKDGLLKLAENRDVDLILSDWNMPEMTGIEFLKNVKADGDTKNIPFIMVTSRNVKEDIMEAVQSGARDYIVKPFTVESIQEKINNI